MTEPQHIAAFCTQCRSRCGCVAVVDAGRLVRIDPLPGHPTGEKLCPKGRAATELVYHPDRITQPMRRTSPKGTADAGWQPITWDAALDKIATRMGVIRDRHGPEQVAFSVTTPSGSHISVAISWIERFIRAYGSPNAGHELVDPGERSVHLLHDLERARWPVPVGKLPECRLMLVET